MRRLVFLRLVLLELVLGGLVLGGLVGSARAGDLQAALLGQPPYRASEWRFVDEDHDCQPTRQEVLIRDAIARPEDLPEPDRPEWVALALDGKGCRVTAGTWVSLYTGRVITNPALLHVDHIVSRREAHDAGAWRWSAAQKRAFANDPLNLAPIEASLNAVKGDRGPAEWTPVDRAGRCFYGTWRAIIKYLYGLTSGAAERAAVRALVAMC